jgi:hypothetical protein
MSTPTNVQPLSTVLLSVDALAETLAQLDIDLGVYAFINLVNQKVARVSEHEITTEEVQPSKSSSDHLRLYC